MRDKPYTTPALDKSAFSTSGEPSRIPLNLSEILILAVTAFFFCLGLFVFVMGASGQVKSTGQVMLIGGIFMAFSTIAALEVPFRRWYIRGLEAAERRIGVRR